MLSQNQIKPSSITLANLLSMLGFRERQQLDFIKLMAFRTCFNKPTLSIIDKSKESITKNWQNEVVDSLIPIWEEAKLKEIYYSHSNRIINDIEAEELLNINFLSLEKGLAWVEGVTQLKFLRSSFFDETYDNEKINIGINKQRWNLTDAKNINDILNIPNSLEYQLYQIAHSLNLIQESIWPSDKIITHVVMYGCLDHYAKERIDFIQPFKGNLYYLTNPRGLFNDEFSLSKILANFFEMPDKENEIQQVLDLHKNNQDLMQWKYNLSALKQEILAALGKNSWCNNTESWYYKDHEFYDLRANIEKRETLKDWPVALDMVDYYLKCYKKDQDVTLFPVYASGKNNRIANTEDLLLAWHEQYGKNILSASNEKPLIVFVSDNLQHNIQFQDTIAKTCLPKDSYEIITAGPAAKEFSLTLATDALAKRIYAQVNDIRLKLNNTKEYASKLSIAPNSTLYSLPNTKPTEIQPISNNNFLPTGNKF